MRKLNYTHCTCLIMCPRLFLLSPFAFVIGMRGGMERLLLIYYHRHQHQQHYIIIIIKVITLLL